MCQIPCLSLLVSSKTNSLPLTEGQMGSRCLESLSNATGSECAQTEVQGSLPNCNVCLIRSFLSTPSSSAEHGRIFSLSYSQWYVLHLNYYFSFLSFPGLQFNPEVSMLHKRETLTQPVWLRVYNVKYKLSKDAFEKSFL